MGLDEIVVVGYGTMKKKDLTGAVASVKQGDIAQVAAPNAMQAMQAKVPGVDMTALRFVVTVLFLPATLL